MGRECPEEIVDVIVNQGTRVAIGVTGQNDKRARGKLSFVWGHLNDGATYFVCMANVIVISNINGNCFLVHWNQQTSGVKRNCIK